MRCLFLLMFILSSFDSISQQRNKNNKAIFLEDVSWTKAKEILTSETVVVIPLGAAAKEHGPHLPLATDFIQAEYYKYAIALERKVVIAPTFSYGFYPAFVKYPGSTTTYFTTSRNNILQVVRTLAAFGPKRFYVINIGVSTTPVLEQVRRILKDEGLVFYYSDYSRGNYIEAEKYIQEKEAGGHADELESSNILFMQPGLVDMTKAVDDTSGFSVPGPLTPAPLPPGKLNKSGIIGFATLATADKGKRYSKNFTSELLKDIDSVQTCALPAVKDNTKDYLRYVGQFTDDRGNKLEVGFENNHLYYIWNNGRDLRNYFPLYKDAEEHFSSMYMDILFISNEQALVNRAWCQFRGESFWLKR